MLSIAFWIWNVIACWSFWISVVFPQDLTIKLPDPDDDDELRDFEADESMIDNERFCPFASSLSEIAL